MSKRSKIWGGALVCLVLGGIAASLLARRSFGLVVSSDLIQLILLLSATASCLPSILRNRGRTRLFWALAGAAFASWTTYQVLWTWIEIHGREVPALWGPDIILFLHIVPMMAALALQPHIKQHDRDLRLGSLDFALLLLWWLYLYCYVAIPWHYVYASDVVEAKVFNSLYLLEKLALLGSLVLVWARSSGLWRTLYAQWFGASLLYSSASYLANRALERHTYYSGSLYDVPLIASIAWMTIPGLLALDVPGEEAQPTRSLPRGVWAARLGMLAVFSLPLFAWFAAFGSSLPPEVRTFRLLLTLVAMAVMGAMVFLKQHFLDIELIRLLEASEQSFEELQLLQRQLVQSEKLASLGQMLGGAAHELNNPLTVILGCSELLTAGELRTEQRSLVEKISHQAKRIRDLVSSLLSFSKQASSAKSVIDVNTLIETALKLCRPQIDAARIQCSTALASPPPQVRGNTNQLLQVFSHILHNAAYAMADAGGKMAVSTRGTSNWVIIQFADSGPGMREPDRVFDPFYTTRPVGQGSGLGLSVCYGIVQEHGGRISCRNREPGGAVFEIELPALATEAAGSAQAASV